MAAVPRLDVKLDRFLLPESKAEQRDAPAGSRAEDAEARFIETETDAGVFFANDEGTGEPHFDLPAYVTDRLRRTVQILVDRHLDRRSSIFLG